MAAMGGMGGVRARRWICPRYAVDVRSRSTEDIPNMSTHDFPRSSKFGKLVR